jgi:endonuclease/exonuclease/phosphatase family metal-dependent hydrolase
MSYRVHQGETLSRIAARFGTTAEKLARVNHLSNPDLIRAGQRLTLPSATDGFDRARAPASPAPTGATMSFDGKARVMTLNLHKLIPASKSLKNSNESFKALKDVADFIKKQNPDVLVLQELDNDVTGPKAKSGVNKQLERLAKLVGATDSAMGLRTYNKKGNGFGNALITRNGFKIDDNVSVALPVDEQARNHTPRTVGIADVIAPDSSTHVNVLYTHTTPFKDKHAKDAREAQIDKMAKLVKDLKDGKLRVRDVNTNCMVNFESSANAATIVGGDFNVGQRAADRLERGTGLKNVIDLAKDRGRANDGTYLKRENGKTKVGERLDHLYFSSGTKVSDAFVRTVTKKRVHDKVGVTDHRAVIADVDLPPSK